MCAHDDTESRLVSLDLLLNMCAYMCVHMYAYMCIHVHTCVHAVSVARHMLCVVCACARACVRAHGAQRA